VDDGDELAAVEPADGVLDDPQAANESAANPARVTTPQRRVRDVVDMSPQ